ncbi:MAG: DNA topoisomerase IV subunit A [Candidatus Thorarchaeota archaeon]|nr:DNA topoisomerase IV subunit A [Candidatus Thorarchaeota archaeon]
MSERDTAIERLRSLGVNIISKIQQDTFPKIELPDRGTSNIVFDTEKNQFVLGPATSVRDSSNLRHIRSFTQLLWVASYAKKLLKSGRTSSLRDLYYSSEAFGISFKDQAESDRIVADLECVVGLAREDFGIFPEEHSSIYGPVIMRYTVAGYQGREIDLTISPDGLPIGPALVTADPIHTDARIILAVESGGMFSRLIETNAWKKFHAILVHLGGQAPRSTRRLMRRLHDSLKLPVFIFTDGDPWGMHIARVIISGSANAAHVEGLTVPDAQWIGVTPSDITKYGLPTEPMNDADLRRLDELARDPRYSDDECQAQIRAFRQLRQKAEQQAFSRHGIDFVVDQYLPAKLH